MSYCRFTEGDVYAYACDGGVQFIVAGSVGEGLHRLCPTYSEAYQYAKTLRDKYGADIPDHAIRALRAEALEEAERISGTGSDVAELRGENARLREELAKWERLAAVIDLPEYPVTQFKPKGLERENARLRELVRDMWEFGFSKNAGANSIEEWHAKCEALADRMREMGVIG